MYINVYINIGLLFFFMDTQTAIARCSYYTRKYS